MVVPKSKITLQQSYERVLSMDNLRLKCQSTDLVLFSIATGKYAEYWLKFVESLPEDLAAIPFSSLTLIIFTDKPNEITSSLATKQILQKIRVVEVPSIGWPEATLWRYWLMSKLVITGNPTFAYVDSDMLAVPEKFFAFIYRHGRGINLVRHVGYYLPSQQELFRNPVRAVERLVSMALLRAMNGGMGSWEKRSASAAYVPRSLRKVYVCGGIWWGEWSLLQKLIKLLASRTAQDSLRGIVARWHDESHLNWFLANHSEQVNVIGPENCLSPSVSLSDRDSHFVIAVDK